MERCPRRVKPESPALRAKGFPDKHRAQMTGEREATCWDIYQRDGGILSFFLVLESRCLSG